MMKLNTCSNIWPIDHSAAVLPRGWKGWPNGKRFALVLTHDVDTRKGHDRCLELFDMEREMGFTSSYNFVPERYCVSKELRNYLEENGCEIGVHDLQHDGMLFKSKDNFDKRVPKINEYIKEWKCEGFRAGAMHCNLNWISELNVTYDCSTFDTDPFEPCPSNTGTIFPFWVKGRNGKNGYVELPYTLPQDFTLFIIMEEKNIDIWKQKLDWIVEKGGMALINTHPDYMNFENRKCRYEEYQAEYYRKFLSYVKDEYKDQFWNALPREVAKFWSDNGRNN